ncbi:NAPRTase [Dictyostelium purpureum]|uniref:nicotinate phosphoribosyltransferase n=1 Tax=Dictyostelium purpureum TaxID=5786 RepID=F0ZSD7_DICPU|nr:NAPRTase [Dictyostelium purpureum]EGC33132.1 NAPRTase [Dictyostelium purpureum]|eukprot:XP_003290327.1 NAPRTase [Dictyostelium purpureum]
MEIFIIDEELTYFFKQSKLRSKVNEKLGLFCLELLIMKIDESNGTTNSNIVRELKRATTVNYVYEDEESKGKMKPLNGFVGPMLTDLYQITMAYSLWKNNRHEIPSVFDLYFRKSPFGGEFTVFAGLEEVIRFVNDFHYTKENLNHIREMIPECDEEFLEYLGKLDSSKVTLYAIKEGSVVFPRIPLLRVEGPMILCQLFETTLLCLINFASLVATNAARHRIAVGKDKVMLEFGLRRAQGPDGAMSASRYSYLGGADGTSNVLAYCFFGIPIRGTHAHSFVTSYSKSEELHDPTIKDKNGKVHNLLELAMQFRDELGYTTTIVSELVAFVAYARTFPNGLVALVDTYDTLASGVPNFLCVALALNKIGYKAVGIRLDSGDLSYLSKATRKMFKEVGEKYHLDYFAKFQIVASNDLNEPTIIALNRQGHEIDVFAIGTNLVTCQAQPALGCVYKLVEINGSPRIKLSHEANKITLPGRKEAYRLYGGEGHPLVDILISQNAADHEKQIPEVGKRVLCLHPFEEQKRVIVTPQKVEKLHHIVFQNGKPTIDLPSLEEIRNYCFDQISKIREDHLRNSNPTPYKVSITKELYDTLHNLWLQSVPIKEMK